MLIELNAVPAKQLEELRHEVLALVVLLLSRDVGLDLRHSGLADGEPAVALLPGETAELRERFVDPLR